MSAFVDQDWAALTPTLPERYRVVDVTPNDDQALRFSTLVPREWLAVTRAGGFSEGLGIATPLACFCASASETSPALVVTQTPIGYEVPLADWLSLVIADGGWQIAGERWVKTIRGLRREVLARRRAAGYWWIRRTTAWIDAGRVFRIEVAATSTDWPRVDALLWPAARAFALLCGSPRGQLEPRRRVVHPDEPRLSIEVPRSWTAEPTDGSRRGRAGFDLGLVRHDRWDAQVQIRFDAGATLGGGTDELEARAMRTLRRAGVVPARRFAVEPWPPGDPEPPCPAAFVRAADSPRGRLLVRTAYVPTPDGVVSLLGLAPPLVDRPLDALRCVRTLQLAAEGARLHP